MKTLQEFRQGGGIVVEQVSMVGLTAEVLDVIFNDALLRKFRSNLQRMDRANSLTLMLTDLDEIVAEFRKNNVGGPKQPAVVT